MNTKNINFIFFGTPDVASLTLEILKEAGYMPGLIVTSPDKPQGRKMLLTPPPVKVWAEENNIPYLQPEKLTEEILDKIKSTKSDLAIVVAYGKIMPETIIKTPTLGSINIHYSLLPKHRGASPVESAILAGEMVTGVSIQQMEFKMDSGPILAEQVVPILPDEKAEALRARLIQTGGELLVNVIPDLLEGKIIPKHQNELEATFCKKIKKEDGLVDLENESVEVLYNKFRAYHKWPRVYFFKNGKRIIITDATLEDRKFVIRKVLPEGKKEITYEEFLKQS
ncbi:MAG: methionyl-tRNA formyltransferase [bacterium]|nr:methionyl-tRNA formyltransferase [bacterium]